jgi:arylsulfatase A-like enzyme
VRWSAIPALATLLLLACTGEKPASVLLVTIDTLRADHLPCYGYESDTAPRVCALAEEGTLFERAISQSSWTLPAHASMMTGLYPSEHRAQNFTSSIDPGAPMLAEILHGRGFATGAFVSTVFVAKYGFRRGFDAFQHFRTLTSDPVAAPLTDRALEWLAAVEEPFFLWVHYYDPHHEHRMHPETGFSYSEGIEDAELSYKWWNVHPLPNAWRAFERNRRTHLSLYDGEIRYVDSHIGRLFDALRDADRYDDTIIVVTSDHGEAFGEHQLVGHDNVLYSELIRVPLILRVPGRAPAREAALVETKDLMPTILDLLEIPRPARARGSLLEGERGFAFSEVHNRNSEKRASVNHEGWKLIYTFDREEFELYDLERDPGETRNLAAAHPEVLARLKDALFARMGVVVLDEEMLEELKSFGYIE